MNTLEAFARGEAARSVGNKMKVFDWVKAARLIKEHGATYAEAGLASDWEYTGGIIFEDGKPDKDSYTYLASLWATPQILIDGDYIDCWLWKDETDWDSYTKWPDNALKILEP